MNTVLLRTQVLLRTLLADVSTFDGLVSDDVSDLLDVLSFDGVSDLANVLHHTELPDEYSTVADAGVGRWRRTLFRLTE